MGAYGYNALQGTYGGPYGPAHAIGSASFLPLGLADGFRAVSESEVVAPSQMIAIGDSQIGDVGFGTDPQTDLLTGFFLAPLPENYLLYLQVRPGTPAASDPGTISMLRRHGGRWNMVFCDGHIQHGSVRAFFDWSGDEVLKLWSRDNQAHRQ